VVVCAPKAGAPFGATRWLAPAVLNIPGFARVNMQPKQTTNVNEQKRDFYISEISFNEENLSLIREICLNVLWFEKYIVNDGTPNNMRGESINITPARNKDGIVITCITQ